MAYTSEGKMGNYNFPDKKSKDFKHYNNPGKKRKMLKDNHLTKSKDRKGMGKSDSMPMNYSMGGGNSGYYHKGMRKSDKAHTT